MKKKTVIFGIPFVALTILFLASCGAPTDSKEVTSNTRTQQKPTASKPSPELTSADKIPHILWEEREAYQTEGKEVFFTDCGLYKGDTDELTGAKCVFKQGEWVLLEPKLEPGDNLLRNGDFSNWQKKDDSLIPVGFVHSATTTAIASISQETKDITSKPYALKFVTEDSVGGRNYLITSQIQLNSTSLKDKLITFQGKFKVLSDPKEIKFSVLFREYIGEKWSYIQESLPISKDDYNKWNTGKLIFKLKDNNSRLQLRCRFDSTGEILLDDFYVLRGNFPMTVTLNSD